MFQKLGLWFTIDHMEFTKFTPIQRALVAALRKDPKTAVRSTAEAFSITRQAVNRHLRSLVDAGVLVASGVKKGRTYSFAELARFDGRFPNTVGLDESLIWSESIRPHLEAVPENVRDICAYGVTEMVNNAKDHSASDQVEVHVAARIDQVTIVVADRGIGIFRKIKEECRLDDERHAIFELVKGKLTTDPARHTGEGIFFTSRMFDEFQIFSGSLHLAHGQGVDWLLDHADEMTGTTVQMEIDPLSDRTTRQVFDRYASEQDDYAFNRTHVVVALARSAAGEKLISRSQGRRVVARLERFKEILFDFSGVDTIGPAFADEIFRVFQNAHPEMQFTVVGATEEVDRMIRRARHQQSAGP